MLMCVCGIVLDIIDNSVTFSECGCYKVCYEALGLVNTIEHAMTFELGMGLKVKLH